MTTAQTRPLPTAPGTDRYYTYAHADQVLVRDPRGRHVAALTGAGAPSAARLVAQAFNDRTDLCLHLRATITDLAAIYDAAKSGQTPAIDVGAFGRLNRAQAILAMVTLK